MAGLLTIPINHLPIDETKIFNIPGIGTFKIWATNDKIIKVRNPNGDEYEIGYIPVRNNGALVEKSDFSKPLDFISNNEISFNVSYNAASDSIEISANSLLPEYHQLEWESEY